MKSTTQPWLRSAPIDSIFILLPTVVPLLIIALIPSYFESHDEVTSLWWIVLVLAIDVGHVYSTLFRFYWERETFRKFRYHLTFIPLASLIAGVVLYSMDAMFFWRVLAYAAVFHFVRQQYGFMRLYSRKEPFHRLNRFIDSAVIYAATLYPLLYWHIYRNNDINWFVRDDFFSLPTWLFPIATVIYALIIVAYVVKEGYQSWQSKVFNIPRNGIIVGTLISWYMGIVWFRGDLIFTMLNVVAHGIPYMALVYIHANRTESTNRLPWKKIGVFIATIFVLAYLEETFWDVLVWKEHLNIFPVLTSLPEINTHAWLAMIVPVLALPQITHYILDGFIWKVSKDKNL